MLLIHFKNSSTTLRSFFEKAAKNSAADFLAPDIFMRPLLCCVVEISASWQHC
jgi:hypothetical protein